MQLKFLSSASLLLSLTSTCAATDDPKPFVTKRYTADPSAHVFEGKLYLYPSHDVDEPPVGNEGGSQYAMRDYHVYSMKTIYGKDSVIDHGVALALEDIPWAKQQLWAPDAAHKNGKYYLYFPAKDKDEIFRIGVAVSDKPGGPFKADKSWIPDTYSIDPASYVDTDGSAYLAWGGIWGGQLQAWQDKTHFNESWRGDKSPPNGTAALVPAIAKLSKDMHKLAEKPRDIQILAPETGKPLLAEDNKRRFFEGAWIFKRKGLYYLMYSTGDTHFMVYATSKSVYGPYTYQDKILDPVVGWTTHGSIVEYKGQWWLFYHDAKSSGKDYLRQVKAKKIWFDKNGKIKLHPTY
ncbi:putative alpha-N-arabinofuranosidase / alpha-L-arabinofuranosidase [Fusarium austroafricanum]|uniref:Putative alpha-N-arabinofuranosidase / alpha-L-arabinofuranosidase n=1 Tax=Fusarium austroafricanum TaxID=2364996 RepID=A0A8H4P2F8_9HYPO|nr:putative alpha-N-arabinofuranosidase / alpha-L-arabinofuranosidase [Fusarium austroafricanum]